VTCSRCGHPPPPSAKFCPECGQSLATRPSVNAPQARTPAHLDDKILSVRGAVEGERKLVTVLFADLRGSLELLVDHDPEDARALLDPVIERMMEAVHRYEGSVNKILGDGIMAIFGAPLAHEDHALRACYAALRMQRAVHAYADELRRRQGVPVQIRVGLNSGEVVVGTVGNDVQVEYTAVGPNTHLAARMEQIAQPGTTLLTAATLRLVEGLVEVKSLGPVPVKGLPEPIEVFELTGVGPTQSRLHAAASRGLAPFVGRDEERRLIDATLDAAGQGRGAAVALVGEAGVGKSRLARECIEALRRAGWLVLEAAAVSYGQGTPFFPVIAILRAYFGVDPSDDAARVREKVTAKVLGLDPALATSTPALFALLDAAGADAGWQALDPPERRQRTLDALRRIGVRESRVQPLLIVLEDLHWVDSETHALLSHLLDGLSSARAGMLLTYRPEFLDRWDGHPHCLAITLGPLPSVGAEALLAALLGDGPGLGPLKRLLEERTGGNPFFLEESVRSLVELGVLAGRPGAYALARALPEAQIPPSVHAVLAARIDRLDPEDKWILQCAAVVGTVVPLAILESVVDLPEAELRPRLARLERARFLHEASLFPEVEWAFRHGLTHDVAYQGLLHDRRRALHAAVADAIEARHADQPGSHVERLALHAFLGEQWERALRYLRQAGDKAAARSAYIEAAAHFTQAQAAMRHLSVTLETLEQSVDLGLELRNALFIAGELPQMFEPLRATEAVAEQLGDDVRRGRVSAVLANSRWAIGDSQGAVEAGLRTLGLAEKLDDPALRAVANQYLGQAYHALGDYDRAIAHLRSAVGSLQGDLTRRRVSMPSPPAVFSRNWLVWCLGERGEFTEARQRARETLEIAAASEQLYSVAQAQFGQGILCYFQGDLAESASVLELARNHCEAGNLRLTRAMTEVYLGRVYSLIDRVPDSIAVLDRTRTTCEAIHFAYCHVLATIWLSQALILAGRLAEARHHAETSLALARGQRARGLEARALRVLGELLASGNAPDVAASETLYGEAMAIAGALGLRPLVSRCRVGVAAVYAKTGRKAQAREALATAAGEFGRMEMTRWRERAERALAEMG
jgi:class 3 adenylate cyclase/tetratricopeptide (TPR) repeat protein